MKKFSYKNINQVPQLKKIVINVGLTEAKENVKVVDVANAEIAAITGQKPKVCRAKKSISNFKLRQGMAIGLKVTLRSDRMYEFFDRLVNVAIPRIRDFRGIPESAVDAQGNFNYGFVEHIAFPEIRPDEVESIHGLQVTITTTAKNHEEGLALLRSLGLPFVGKSQQ